MKTPILVYNSKTGKMQPIHPSLAKDQKYLRSRGLQLKTEIDLNEVSNPVLSQQEIEKAKSENLKMAEAAKKQLEEKMRSEYESKNSGKDSKDDLNKKSKTQTA